MDKTSGVGQTCDAQMTETTKQHGRFGKRHIAAIAIGTAVALAGIAGIAATIATGGLFAAGVIGATTGAVLGTAALGTLSGAATAAIAFKKGLESRKVEAQLIHLGDMLPITVFPDENYKNVTRGAIDLVLNHPENVATCMMCDGTTNQYLDQNGDLFNEKTQNNDIIKFINQAKSLDDDTILELITKGQASSKITDTQAWKDLARNCRTFNIYGTELTYHDPKVEGAGNESYAGFMQRVADEIKQYEIQKLNKQQGEAPTNEELKQIQDKQIKFFRQLLKHAGQALAGGTVMSTFFHYYDERCDMPLVQDNNLSHYTVSLSDDDTISVETICTFAALPNADTNQKTPILLNGIPCLKETIIATIPLSEGTQGNDSQFTTKESKISLSDADATLEPKGTRHALFVNTSSAKTALEMTCTSAQDDQPPTFTIKEPGESEGSMKPVKTLQFIDGKWTEQVSDNS